jgi:hypothetical protein
MISPAMSVRIAKVAGVDNPRAMVALTVRDAHGAYARVTDRPDRSGWSLTPNPGIGQPVVGRWGISRPSRLAALSADRILLSRPVRTPDCESEAPTPKTRHELGGHVRLEASVDFAGECLSGLADHADEHVAGDRRESSAVAGCSGLSRVRTPVL